MAVFMSVCTDKLKYSRTKLHVKTTQVTVYPVELFHILIGQMNGTAPGVVHSSLKNGDNTSSLQDAINVDCVLFNYIIFTTDSIATFILQVLSFKILKQHSLYLVFTTICPLS